jgi:D-alanyl-lipoteichoic acid acyltransferase DltB (MBOAT superfamily)
MLGIHNIPLPLLRVILPPGISFYTFQEVAYVVDVYKGRVDPTRSFAEYSLFISLFPHLIAGPIQRPKHLLPQVQMERTFDADRAFDGVLLICSGLVRKCIVADNCALLADAAFGGRFGPPDLVIVLIGTYAFAWQVYGDFSGYSDIARGSAQLLGFHFMVNFQQPYLSQSFREFWRRWHISLSSWLRDYLYIPLGGSTRGPWITARNVMTTMLVAGLWHGANWTFIVFGAIHGCVMIVERLLVGAGGRTGDAASPRTDSGFASVWTRRILTFNLFCLTLIVFRATSLGSALQLLSGLGHLAWRKEYLSAFVLLSVFALPLFAVDLLLEETGQEYPFALSPYAIRTGLAGVELAALALLSGIDPNAFIYFRF